MILDQNIYIVSSKAKNIRKSSGESTSNETNTSFDSNFLISACKKAVGHQTPLKILDFESPNNETDPTSPDEYEMKYSNEPEKKIS